TGTKSAPLSDPTRPVPRRERGRSGRPIPIRKRDLRDRRGRSPRRLAPAFTRSPPSRKRRTPRLSAVRRTRRLSRPDSWRTVATFAPSRSISAPSLRSRGGRGAQARRGSRSMHWSRIGLLFAFAAGSLAVTLVAVPLARWLARHLGLVDRPDG